MGLDNYDGLDAFAGDAAEEAECWDVLCELLDLSQAAASVIGRGRHASDALDDAWETSHLETVRRALDEFDELDEGVRDRVLAAAGQVS